MNTLLIDFYLTPHSGIFVVVGSLSLRGLFSSCSEWWLLLFHSMGSKAYGLQQLQLPGSRAQAQQLWCMGLVALQHVESPWIWDRTHVSCIGRQTLHHWGSPLFCLRRTISVILLGKGLLYTFLLIQGRLYFSS